MEHLTQLLQYTWIRFTGSHDDQGEVSATTVIWAAALVLVALSVSALLVGRIQAKADSIAF